MTRRRWPLARPLARPLALPLPVLRDDAGGGGGPATWDAAVALYSPVIWYKFDEASGALLDYGSLTTTPALTNSPTQNQAGLLGNPHAYLFDGLAQRISGIDNDAGWAGLATFSLCFLCKPADFGEADAGYFVLNNSGSQLYLRFNSGAAGTLNAFVDFSGTNAQSISTTTITTDAWQLITMTLDTDSKIRIYVNADEVSYGTQTAGTGSKVDPVDVLLLMGDRFNNSCQGGLVDEFFMTGSVLSIADLSTLWTLTGGP